LKIMYRFPQAVIVFHSNTAASMNFNITSDKERNRSIEREDDSSLITHRNQNEP
jgi:hypothetical protein